MLPTEEIIKNHTVKHFEEGALLTINDTLIGKVVDSLIQIQHLHIIISQYAEPIKKGDNIFNRHMNRLEIASKDCEINLALDMYYSKGKTKLRNNIFKLIATTDLSLIIKKLVPAGSTSSQIISKKIPGLHQSFLEKFVNDPDGEYEIEYEQNGSIIKQSFPKNVKPRLVLKLNQDNTVNITQCLRV